MTLLSEIYDVTLKRGIRGAAKNNYIRATIQEFFTTSPDFSIQKKICQLPTTLKGSGL